MQRSIRLDGGIQLDLQVFSVNAWGQRVKPDVGTLVGLVAGVGEGPSPDTIAAGVWVPVQPDVAYSKIGFYLGRGLVLVAKVAEDVA